jgi:hypothetical protein
MMKTLLTLILGFFCSVAMACEIQKLASINYALSTSENKVIPYSGEKPLQELPFFRAVNCSQTALEGQYLMVALGPEVVDFEDTVRGVNFNGDFGYKKCELEEAPFKATSYEDRVGRFKEDWNLIHSCLQVVVEDEGPQKLNLPKEQPGCQVTKHSNHKMSFNGGFCFMKPNFGSSFLIKVQVKPECTDLNVLKKLNIKTNDLSAAINLYLAGDASGKSGQLKALSNTKVRVSINPLKNLIRSSDDYGADYPTWPETFNAPDIHLGKMVLKNPGNDLIQVEMPLLVNNNCTKKCDGNFCQSACDYAQPIVSEFSLYELNKGKKELLTTWYDGGIAPAGFQGFIRGVNFEVPTTYFESGKTYTIEALFTDPRYDFDRFKKTIKNKLNTIDQRLGKISHSGIPGVQEIPSFQSSRVLPSLQGIPSLIFEKPLDSVSEAVEQLRSFLSFHLWPPYYAGACLDEACTDFDKSYVSLGVVFKINGTTENEELVYDTLKVFRSSQIVRSYEQTTFKHTKIKCEFNP